MRDLLGPIVLLAALALFFFGSLLFAAASFPTGYDWRQTVMSSLASPRENPTAYRIASYGLAASGLVLSLLGFYVRRSLKTYAPKWSWWACMFFFLGGILLTISALIRPGHTTVLGLRKAHAKIAQAAGVGFGTGMALTLPAILRLPVRRAWVRVTTIVLVVVPMTVYLLCRIFLAPGEPYIPASAHPTLHALLGSLSFWEWVGSVSVYLFLALITLALGRSPETVARSVTATPGRRHR
jgi:ACR3 family arsenite efflux pump ArsB